VEARERERNWNLKEYSKKLEGDEKK